MAAHARTTVILRTDLIERAREISGIQRKTDLIHAGLESLIHAHALRRIAAMGGSIPSAKAPRRRRWRTKHP